MFIHYKFKFYFVKFVQVRYNNWITWYE